MMRFLAAFLMLAGSAFGQTNVGSPFISGTVRYTKAMSPISFGLIRIASGHLIIDPGVEMIATSSNSQFQLINGSSSTLSILGDESNPVTIRSGGAYSWRGITNTIRSTRPRIEIANAMLLGLGSQSKAIELFDADFLFTNSVFQGSRLTSTGTTTTGFINSRNSGAFVNCLIDGFTNGAVITKGVVLQDTDIRNTVTPITTPQNANVTISLVVE